MAENAPTKLAVHRLIDDLIAKREANCLEGTLDALRALHLVGRELVQVGILHSNDWDADNPPALVEMLRDGSVIVSRVDPYRFEYYENPIAATLVRPGSQILWARPIDMEKVTNVDAWFTQCVISKSAETDVALYTAVGLAGETGEICELIKKSRRTGDRHEAIDIAELTAELGDVLFYLAALANMHGITLAQIVDINIEKRVSRGLLPSSDSSTS